MASLRRFERLLVVVSIAVIGTTVPSRLATATEAPDLQRVMRITVDSWIASQKDGFFPYGFDFLTDRPLESGRMSESNLIRQTGTAFTLARYYELVGEARLQEPIRQSLTALGQLSLPIRKGTAQRILEETRILSIPVGRWKLRSALERLGLLYQPSGEGKVVSPDGTYRRAIAGTVALALLTEMIYAQVSGDQSFASLREAWLEGLLVLRIPGRGFRQDPTMIDDTDYDNGEGWLALAVYADRHPDDARAMKALADLDETLMRRYSENPRITFFGWGGMAAAQRYRTTRAVRFLAFLRDQADKFLTRRQQLGDDENTCGTMEGVTAMLAVLEENGERETDRARAIRGWLARELTKVPRLQIASGQRGLALGGEAYLQAPRMAEYAGGLRWGLYEPATRVDAAAHCVSALVTVQRHQLQ